MIQRSNNKRVSGIAKTDDGSDTVGPRTSDIGEVAANLKKLGSRHPDAVEPDRIRSVGNVHGDELVVV